ncbi:hypothetical protein OG552_00970 [Streptomyces sp. NBC_01476]|uniref:hypothetical protein n=1 Tax=Streptomyces sp. NBC_01476 TaxID=2903881 RepID=UPI002E337983|nr:hypothetical protein [Streptomyces sp. NBC_01476]
MPHFLVVAALVLAAWTLLSLPLGVLIGRRLRHVNATALPPGCAYADARADAPADAPTAAAARPGSHVPGCTARPCRAVQPVAGHIRPCTQPKPAGDRQH